MKKKKISGLSLNKKTVSTLSKSLQNNVLGGGGNNGSYDGGCGGGGTVNCHLSNYACSQPCATIAEAC